MLYLASICVNMILWYHNSISQELYPVPFWDTLPNLQISNGSKILWYDSGIPRCQCSGNILPLSESLYPRAKIIFLLVSIRQGFPCSILPMVRDDTSAFLASSALLIKSPSLIFRKVLRPNLFSWYSGIWLVPYLSTLSFNSFPHLQNGSFFGLILTCSPVFGLRPVYDLYFLT